MYQLHLQEQKAIMVSFQKIFCKLKFLKSLTFHFLNIIRNLFKKEEIYIQNTKFKNLLVLDLSTDEIIINLKSINNKKYVDLGKNEKLWQEIIHHCKFLHKQYKSENNNKFDMTNSNYNFIKFECTSTYPRLLFVIKYVPIMNGISIIHVLTQNKLSRKIPDEELTLSRGYREIDIIYGRDYRDNNEIDILYPEPKKLREIEKFLIEFFISTVNKENLFYNQFHELKYFDYYLLSVIDEVSSLNLSCSYEMIFKKILKKLYELYLNGIETENGYGKISTQNQNININMNNINYTNTQNNIISSANLQHIYNSDANSISIDKNFVYRDYRESNSDIGINLNTNYMNINREFIIRNIIHLSHNYIENPSNTLQSEIFNLNTKNDNTLILSRNEETQSKMNQNENDQSFNFIFTDLSGIDNLNEDEGNNIGNNNRNYNNMYQNQNINAFSKHNLYKHRKAKENLVDKKNFLGVSPNVSNMQDDSFVKSNLSFFFKSRNNHHGQTVKKKMRPSFSDINNKINSKPLKIINFNRNENLNKNHENIFFHKQGNISYNNIAHPVDDVDNIFNSQSFGNNSAIVRKRQNYRRISFNGKPLHSFTMDLDFKNNEDDLKKNVIFQSYENNIKNKIEISHSEIEQNIDRDDSNDFNEEDMERENIPNFMSTYPVAINQEIRQSVPTFRAIPNNNNKIT